MNMKNGLFWIMVSLFSLLLMTGCATLQNWGMLATPGTYGKKVTIEELQKHWNEYNVYYAGIADDIPAAVLFAPKDSGNKLVAPEWHRVEDQKTLSNMVTFIKTLIRFDPRLYSIIGPGGQVYGYVFSLLNNVNMKPMGKNTLYVFNVPSPLFMGNGPDFGTGRH